MVIAFYNTPTVWAYEFGGTFPICFRLYFLLLGLNLLGSPAKVVDGCTAGAIFGDQTNPVAAVMIGSLATFVIQLFWSTTSMVQRLLLQTRKFLRLL